MDQDRVIAVGLLTQRDLMLLGPTFDRLWPVEELRGEDGGSPSFQDLLLAIDEADEKLTGERIELPPQT